MQQEKEKRDLLAGLSDVDAPVAPVVVTPAPPVEIPAPVEPVKSAPTPPPAGGIDINTLATVIATVVDKVLEGKETASKIKSDYAGSNGIPTPNAEDILKEEDVVIFAARGTGYHTHSYERNGLIYKAPYGCISFQETITDIITNAAGVEDILHICTYACRSKKALEYLRNHPELGISFAEVAGENLNQMISNPKYMEAQTTVAYYNKARSLPDDVKLSMADNYGIAIHDPNVNIDYELMEIWRKEDKEASESIRARREESFTTNVK